MYDEVDHGRERFFNFRKIADYADRLTETISLQPIPGWTHDRDNWITLTGANIAMETDDYSKAVSDIVQMDMRWFFDQWIRKSGNAHVDVEQHVDPAANGQFRLWGTIQQAPGDGFRKLLIPLVRDKEGKPEARVVLVVQPEKKFEFLLPTKPGALKPDPFQNTLPSTNSRCIYIA